MSNRQLIPHNIVQGAEENIARKFSATPWGSTPTNVTVKAWDQTVSPRVDVSSSVLTGQATVSGDEITTPLIGNLTVGKIYRIDIKFTAANGNTFQPYFVITAEE